MTLSTSTGKPPNVSIEPDVLLPVQHQGRTRLGPAQQLMLAVLEDALASYRRHGRGTGRRDRRLFGEVADWFSSEDTTWTFSFVNVCRALGFEPSAIREAITRGGRPVAAGLLVGPMPRPAAPVRSLVPREESAPPLARAV
ncbi:MAG: hypothetical protein U0807_18485 [Candidatus Binatia bacterium]